MMDRFIEDTTHIYIACGATDFRKQMDGLAVVVNTEFQLDPFSDKCAFIFCNRKRNALKVLRYDGNGFILASKKLLNGMKRYFFLASFICFLNGGIRGAVLRAFLYAQRFFSSAPL